jgi:hypothetical protein
VAGPAPQPPGGSPGRGGGAQRLVRATMLKAGGYWRPLAAVARLLEELGELSELLERRDPDPDPAELGGELADLWIITTALADQFLAEVPEPSAGPPAREPGGAAVALVIAAGQIARVVNHYDGPKTPREGAEMPSLSAAVSGFQVALGALASALGIDLGAAVEAKIAAIHRRGDMRRFAHGAFDPSTAGVLSRFTVAGPAALDAGADPLGVGDPGRRARARLWGSPDWSADSIAEGAGAIAPSLEAFLKAARAERLDGYLVAGPPLADGAGRAAWLGALLAALGIVQRGSPGAGRGPQALELDGLSRGGVTLSAGLLLAPADQTDGGDSPETLLVLAPSWRSAGRA